MGGQSSQDLNVEHGTLGIVVLAKSGIVFVADSRSTSADGSYVDTADKIFQLGDSAACTIAGTVAAHINFFGHLLGFDLPKATTEFASTIKRQVGIMPIDVATEGLSDALTMHLAAGLSGIIRPTPLSDGGTIGTVVVAGYARVRGVRLQIEAYKYGLNVATMVGQSPVPVVYPSKSTLLKKYWSPNAGSAAFGILLNGNSHVVRAILEDNAPELDPSRRVPAIARYFELRNQRKLDSISLDESTALANALVSESIRIGGNQLGIGGQIDVAQITPDKGFRWVAGHEPDRKRSQSPATH